MGKSRKQSGWGGALSLIGGVLLVVAFFLPGARACKEVIHPYEEPVYAPFYLYGLLVVWTLLRGIGGQGRAGRRRQGRYGAFTLAMLLWSLALWLDVLASGDTPLLSAIVCFVLAAAAAALLRGLGITAAARYSIGRSTWTGAVGVAQVPVIAFRFADKVLYGTYLMTAALLLIFAGGLLIERDGTIYRRSARESSRSPDG